MIEQEAEGKESTVSFDHVYAHETATIRSQRKIRQQAVDAEEFSGISISGGGIRSSSFALGILQALNSGGVLQRLDYLSTVSGGGYVGSSWTWFNHLWRTGKIKAEQGKYFFPFGVRAEGARTSEPSVQSKILSYLRQHGNYLVPGFGLNYISGFAVVFRNMLLSLLVYVSLLVVVFCGFGAIEDLYTSMLNPFVGLIKISSQASLPTTMNLFLMLATCGLLVVSVLGVIYGPVTLFLSSTSDLAYRVRNYWQRLLGLFSIVAISFAIIGLLPVFILESRNVLVTSSGGVLGIVGGIWHFYRQQQSGAAGISPRIIGTVSSALTIIAILSLAYFIAEKYSGIWKLAAPVGLFFGFMVNINQFGIGRMYRDRLSEGFLPNPEAIHTSVWHPATQANTAELREMCTADDQGPYHLINSTVILIDSRNKKFQSRGGDNFILSPLYCGSDATQWVTNERFNNNSLTLATAMATSGAAANPHAGINGSGISKGPLVSFLMFILGLRLGLYVLNPLKKAMKGLNAPNYFAPGLFQGLLGSRFDIRARFLSLSDGSHFENTAAYELIRRRVSVVIASEAGQDQDFSFADLGNLVEKVRVDFGVNIRFLADFDLRYLMPGSAGTSPSFENRYDMAKRGYAIAEIRYPAAHSAAGALPAKTGWLFVVKPTLTKDLPADLYGYKDANPQFPNETTLDQFFGEVQVESYRELGYQLAKQLVNNEHFQKILLSKQSPTREVND